MKNLINIILLAFFVSLLVCSCKKEPEPKEATNLPNEVNLGESAIYLNGELIPTYKADCKYGEVNKIMSYVFYDSINLVTNIVGFDWLPQSTGNYELHDERILFVKALTSFSQIVDEDLEGYSYELEDPEEGFCNIEYLDTIQQVAKGRFKAKFKRTSTNGNGDLGLPKRLLFQGVFHEKYVKY